MLVEGVEAGGVFGVGNGQVVGVDDEKLGVGRIAESLGDGLGLSEGGAQREREE